MGEKMQSVINKSKVVDKPFPKLMSDRNIDVIVLFLSPENGVCVYPNSHPYYMVYNDDSWDVKYFVDFGGEVTLSNG